PPPPQHQQRLESDADAVRITTLHRAKGLEFGVVLAPFLWTSAGVEWSCARYHDADGTLVLDAGCRDGPPADGARRFKANRDRAHVEALAEECRLTYVAVTRAQHRGVLWWAPTKANRPLAGLTETLLRFAQDDQVGALPDAQLRDERLAEVARRGAPHLAFSRVTGADGSATVPTSRGQAATPLRRGPVPSAVPRDWIRASYSRLKALHEPADVEIGERLVVDEPDPRAQTDADAPPPPPAPERGGGLDREVLLSGVAGGATFGTVVHAVLEHVDFSADDLRDRIAAELARWSARHLLTLDDPGRVVDALVAAVHTPLGLPGGPLTRTGSTALRLADVAPADRLDEVAFELGVAGGSASRPGSAVSVAAIADVVATHLPAGDPLEAWPQRLGAELGGVAWRGYLAGFIDLVVRSGDGYLVIDHKTNTLGPPGQPLQYGHYTPSRLADAMVEEHYPLQALGYLVALHRQLRLRLGAAYEPDRHLAGVAYLFLRGMGGPDTPITADGVCGVFTWRPPTALVVALDELLDRGAR
ncbi:MAG: PD-(D/E)XK nuclease family protein, partial [Actinobacteria bacterium]|nr:PD-(D/E)XK nuclease family protein [Actinomycetota bacterium]